MLDSLMLFETSKTMDIRDLKTGDVYIGDDEEELRIYIKRGPTVISYSSSLKLYKVCIFLYYRLPNEKKLQKERYVFFTRFPEKIHFDISGICRKVRII